MNGKVLLVEDAIDAQTLVQTVLKPLGCDLLIASNSDQAMKLIKKEKITLLLLDVDLSGESGFDLCAKLQESDQTKDIPVMFISGKSDISDKLTAFSLGAEDYIVKPFAPLELRARVEAKLKKLLNKAEQGTTIHIGALHMDLTKHRAWLVNSQQQEKKLELTPLEFKILYHLAKRPEQVFTRDQLLTAVWGENANVYDRTVDSHVYSLRKKLGNYSNCVDSVLNVGYRLDPKPLNT